MLTAVATDGRRLALVERPLADDEVPEGDAILPGKVVSELEKLVPDDGAITIQLTDARASFRFGDTVLTSKLVDGNYPNYRQVIPTVFSNAATIPRATFAEVLNRVSMVLSDTSSSLTLKLAEATATVCAVSSDVGEASEPFEVSYDGEPVEISFNPQFLMEPLRFLESDQVTLHFNDRFSPMTLSADEGFVYVIMPMRH
jgi:DNA polymerase-3 subunit beta